MNSHEKIIAAVRFNSVDHIPVFPMITRFAARQAGIFYSDYCRDAEKLSKAQLFSFEKFRYDSVSVCSDPYRESAACGAVLEFPPNDVPRPVRPAIDTKERLLKLGLPDPFSAERMKDRIDAIRVLKETFDDEIPVWGWNALPKSLQEKSVFSQTLIYSVLFLLPVR